MALLFVEKYGGFAGNGEGVAVFDNDFTSSWARYILKLFFCFHRT